MLSSVLSQGTPAKTTEKTRGLGFRRDRCVFDTDAHSATRYRRRQAERDRGGSFQSGDWLHVQEQTVDRHDVTPVQRFGSLRGQRDATAWNTLADAFQTARERAQQLDQRHAGNNSPARSNSDVWRLVDQLRDGT